MKEIPINSNGWKVLCCGCTDCFVQAVFVEKAEAEKWAEANCCNPEGWIIQHVFCELFEDI